MKQDIFKNRLNVFAIAVVFVFGALFSRLWYLQVLAGSEFAQMAEGNRMRSLNILAPRGLIEDRNGNFLVTNQGTLIVCIQRKVLRDKKVLKKLSVLVKKPVREIVELAKKSVSAEPFRPIPVSDEVDFQTVAYLKEHEIEYPGVSVEVEPVRHFREDRLASHILGYVGEISDFELREKQFSGFKSGDMIGKAGVEKVYDTFLRGRDGVKNVEVNAMGKPVRILSRKDPKPGSNLILTIDPSLQKVVEEAIPYGIKLAHENKYDRAEAGTVIVMNPSDGEILALASYPAYSPKIFTGGISKNEWKSLNRKESNYPLNNRALMGYPIGSIMKPVTAIGALTDKLAAPDSFFECSGKWTGPTQLMQKFPKLCWNRFGHGHIDFNRAIIESCDVVFYELGYRFYKMGSERLQWWSRIFGLGKKTGIDLPNEKRGRVPTKAWKKAFNKDFPEYQTWFPGDTINMGIGQGDLLVSPVQIARVYCAIANGGYLLRPHLAKRIESYNGKIIRKFGKETIGKIPCTKETLYTVQEDLRSVVTEGTAMGAFNGFPLSVAGKTGTAQMKGKDDFAWFACYAPMRSPKYVVVVMIEQGGHGSSTAAPVARRILEYLFKVRTSEKPVATAGD